MCKWMGSAGRRPAGQRVASQLAAAQPLPAQPGDALIVLAAGRTSAVPSPSRQTHLYSGQSAGESIDGSSIPGVEPLRFVHHSRSSTDWESGSG